MRLTKLLLLLLTILAHSAAAQDGFEKLTGRHLTLITDLPLDDSLRELPEVFDAAIPVWCEVFGVDTSQVADWQAHCCLMLDRQRFKAAGLLPGSLPEFPHGYQVENDMWVIEQPTQYYRRHLLLHEGTHWFMARCFGSTGPPWLMEGTAEWLATHRWHAGQLELGIIPHSREDVPMWGRISLIQQQLQAGQAPSLETILRYDHRAHQSVDAYAWSWAAVIFLHHHPSTEQAFNELLSDKLRSDNTNTQQLLRALNPRKSLVRAEWSAMLTGLDYGFVPSRELVRLEHRTARLTAPVDVSILATKGWQTTGVTVEAGDWLEVTATGQYEVGSQPQPWLCLPDGVTLRYVQGQPLGKLLLAIAAPQTTAPEHSQTLPIIPIGSSRTVKIEQSGQVLLRINELGAGLDDNSGQLQVQLKPAQPQSESGFQK